MSPRQISFLTSHAEGAWAAQEQRHFDGKPFDARVANAMPFYGATAGEEARLRAAADAKADASPKKPRHRPDVLRFVGPDASPSESEHSSHPSESSRSDSATSPATSEHSPSIQPKQQKQQKQKSCRYGTPEMPRGSANLPHHNHNHRHSRSLSSGSNYNSSLKPRTTTGHVKHLPRAEKLPLTGYELLASHLASAAATAAAAADDDSDSPARPPPLYRKFEALNHRILLHLQDELSELEEQLHRLDTADTQTRRLQSHTQTTESHILPASRRAGASAGGELQWHRTDVLGKIGYKLGQYNHVLSSFTETQGLAAATRADVGRYRAYLDAQKPIAERETRFLDARDDLVTLAAVGGVPRNQDRDRDRDRDSNVLSLAVAVAVAVLVPVLAFSAVPTLAGRMGVVLLVAFTVFGAHVQAESASGEQPRRVSRRSTRDVVCCAAVYGAVMSVIACRC